MIYILYILLLLVLLSVERSSNNKIFWRVLIPIFYVLLIGLRSPSIGMDSQDYADAYNAGYDSDYLEVGYVWLSHSLLNLGFSYTILFLLMAFISVFFITLSLIEKKGNDYTVSALLFYVLTYGFLINGMRQGVSCAIFLYACKYINLRKPLKYVILILLASLFHSSSFLLLPLYFLTYLNMRPSIHLILYLVSYVGVFYNVSSYFPEVVLLGDKDYSKYIDSLTMEDPSLLGVLVSKSIQIIILLLMLLNKKSIPNGLFNLTMLGFIISNLGFHFFIVGRITIYFAWIPYLFYWLLLNKDSRPIFGSRELSIFLVVGIHVVLLVHSVLAPDNMQYPYLFFWE